MAPATRRSSGLGANGNGTSNLDQILEHFNQFKRKHITQNRDIIKTNALAQLRIKELEDKVLAMEAERTNANRDMINIRRRMENAERAALCMRQGWQMIGAGMAALSSIDGFHKLMSEEVQEQQHRAAYASSALQKAFEQASQRAGMRISLDPNVLPGGVVRNVARPPESGLDNVMEENTAEMTAIFQAEAGTTQHDSIDNYERTLGESIDDEDENDSDHHDDGDQVSFSAGEEEDTIRIPQLDVPEDCSPINVVDRFQRPQAADSFLLSPGDTARRLHHATSIDSLSSFADDEEVELSTDDEAINSTRSTTNTTIVRDPKPSVSTRKRKTPNSSPQHARRTPSSSVSSTPSKDFSQSDNEDLSANEGVRPSRRASMRDRKSINYALPKLNTKMRKPDPVDMVPAARDEHRSRSIVDRTDSPNDAEDREVVRSSDTISAESGMDSEQESPRRRKLKGKHEVASTGNLREIRRRHEEQHQKQQSANGVAEGSEAIGLDRTKEGDESVETGSSHSSPRRASGRRSLRNRSSFETEAGQGEEHVAQKEEKGRKECENQDLTTFNAAQSPAFDQDSSLSSIFTSTLGTPIPKAFGRGNQQGSIKALTIAGRLQKTGTSSTNNHRPVARQMIRPLHQTQTKVQSNGDDSTSKGTYAKPANTVGNILSKPSSMNKPFAANNRSVSAGSHHGNGTHANRDDASNVGSGANGDPAKRHSLHAAMTSPNMTELGIR